MKFVRFLLFPFAILYQIITAIRNFLFDVNIFKSTSFSMPVIVVGNLSVGGTGKTPQIEYLVRLLKNNFKTGVVSRGYGRKTTGFILLNNKHTAKDVGDEPLQYFKKFKDITVAVDENRVEGITKLVDQKSPEVILLDDAFQHRKVKGSFYILLTKYNDLFINDYLLPTGNLRESRVGAKRADAIVVTKCPQTLTEIQRKKIKAQFSKYEKPIYFTTIKYADKISGKYSYTIETLQTKHVLLVTGIANPKPLLNFLSDNKVTFLHLKYSDHHDFTSKNIDEIESAFNSISSKEKLILTTEKDFTRLENKLENVSFLAIETCFLNDGHSEFNENIFQNIKLNTK
jgi:tetraacyldisaccharide 4'-kinase